MRNFYEILNVTENVTKEELKSSYKKMAKKYHPDLNPGDKEAEEKFKEINYAYEDIHLWRIMTYAKTFLLRGWFK